MYQGIEAEAIKPGGIPEREWRAVRRVRLNTVASGVIVACLLLGIWEVLGLVANPIDFVTPVATASQLVRLAKGRALYDALGVSLMVLYVGFGIGTLGGLVVGFILGRFRSIGKLFRPYYNFLSAIPAIILLPLLVVWVGIGTEAQILLVVSITMWPVLLNTIAGIVNTAADLHELGRSMKLSEWTVLRHVLLPASAPYIYTGLRISIGLAMIAMIIGEFELQSTGLGFLLTIYAGEFDMASLLAVIVVTSAISLVNVGVVNLLARRFCPWVGK